MTVVPHNGTTTTRRPLLKIVLDKPARLNDIVTVERSETVIGIATLSTDQEGTPGTRYEFRDTNAPVGIHEYKVTILNSSVEASTSVVYRIEILDDMEVSLTGVYETLPVFTEFTLTCPVPNPGNDSFRVRAILDATEPSGVYEIQEASGIIVYALIHTTGTTTVLDEVLNPYAEIPGVYIEAEWTLVWPTPSEQSLVATVPSCGI
jgi:hypothetical protein